MSDTTGTATFRASGAAYDAFMGRYARALAEVFFELCVPPAGERFLDVGCGPGALASVAAAHLGPPAVTAVDPAPQFVAACRERLPGVQVHHASAEHLPFADDGFGAAAAQLVFHFVSDPARAAREMARVVRPGGIVAACVWDMQHGMEMLRAFWDAALDLDPEAPDEARTLRFGGPGELAGLFAGAGLDDLREDALTVTTEYTGFDELWSTFLAGIGPAGHYTVTRTPAAQHALKDAFDATLGRPRGPFRLAGVARTVRGRTPR